MRRLGVSYTSQPGEVTVFLNNIAFARDTFTLPGGVDVQVILPTTAFPETLLLHENGKRVPRYRISREDTGIVVAWQSAADSEQREVTLEYLLYGITWQPKYDMWLGADEDETADFHFYAEIRNQVLPLENVSMRLAAGRVDVSISLKRAIILMERVGTGGSFSDLEEDEDSPTQPEAPAGTVNIQYIYTIGQITAKPGETVFTRMLESSLPIHLVHEWTANTEEQARNIYLVTNDSELLFAEGKVRAYREGIFVGGDTLALTPIGSESRVRVGYLQTVRVKRSEKETTLSRDAEHRLQHNVTLKISNSGEKRVTMDVIDRHWPNAVDFSFISEPEHQGGNRLRWTITLGPVDETTITYEFKR